MGASDDRDQTDDVVVHTTSGGELIRVALADLPEAAVVQSDVWDRPSAERRAPVDDGGARNATDVAVVSPFMNDSSEPTMEAVPIEIDGMKTVAGIPTLGAAALELRTQADGGPSVDSDVPTASASQLGRAPASLEPHASPVPEITLEGAVVPVLEEEAPGFEEETRAVLEGELDGTTGVLSDLDGAAPGRAHLRAPEPVELLVGGYRTTRRLGEGGMAEVFLATQPGSARPVVLKRLQKHLSEDPRQMKMFRREARIASGLEHPNIVKIIDFAEERGSMFLVMEYLDGVDFRDLAARWWSKRPLPLEAVVELCAQAALGLDYAHAAPGGGGRPGNLVHRDISPENLFLTREGQVKVLDFGIARHGHEHDDLTRTGEMKGKVPYMSPEQVAGDPLDGRSDLWSLTVVLYWLLTGHRPFDGATEFMTIKQIMERDPVPPAEVNDLVPRALNDVVLRGLSRAKDDRFARGKALHDALMGLIAPLDDRKLGRTALGAEVAALAFPTKEPVPYHPAAVPYARW